MASEQEFISHAHREFDTPNKRKRKSSVGRTTEAVVKMIAKDLKKRDTGGSFITVAYYFDKNKDKALSEDEFHDMLQRLGFSDIKKEISDEVFKHCDENDDGRVDYFEFIKAMNNALGDYRSPKKPTPSSPPPAPKAIPKADIRLYTRKKADPFSGSVIIALEEMGVPYDKIELSDAEIQKDEFGKFNSRHQTPVLITPDAVLHEVVAILSFLAITNSKRRGAFPSDESALAQTLTRLSETQYLFKLVQDITHLITQENWQELRDERGKVEKAIHDELKLWNGYVEGDFILGSDVSLVDPAVYSVLSWIHSHDPKSLDQYQKLKVFHDKFAKRYSVQALKR